MPDNENRAEEAEREKQEMLRKAKSGKGEWHESLASDSESAVSLPFSIPGQPATMLGSEMAFLVALALDLQLAAALGGRERIFGVLEEVTVLKNLLMTIVMLLQVKADRDEVEINDSIINKLQKEAKKVAGKA